MQILTKKICGIILLTIPSIIYGGYFLLMVLSGQEAELELTSFQQSMFRAGHAHAGVLVILSLVAQVLTDHANLSKGWEWLVRISFPLLPVKNKTYTAGEFSLSNGRTLYINRALGHLWQVRFNVRPEITIFRLEKAI